MTVLVFLAFFTALVAFLLWGEVSATEEVVFLGAVAVFLRMAYNESRRAR